MNALKRFAVTCTAVLCLLAPLLPQTASAEAVLVQPESNAKQESNARGEELTAQIKETYKKAKKAARVKSFKGKCGKYVNRQLVLLGINKKYIGCNGNRAFDIYKNKKETTGGYRISAYSAKKYTLKEALEAIEREDPHARNILVGFQKGTSKAGKSTATCCSSTASRTAWSISPTALPRRSTANDIRRASRSSARSRRSQSSTKSTNWTASSTSDNPLSTGYTNTCMQRKKRRSRRFFPCLNARRAIHTARQFIREKRSAFLRVRLIRRLWRSDMFRRCGT